MVSFCKVPETRRQKITTEPRLGNCQEGSAKDSTHSPVVPKDPMYMLPGEPTPAYGDSFLLLLPPM